MIDASSTTAGVAVAVRGLRKSFGSRLVLRDLTFEIAPGEIFVLMGPSGAGKSMILRHLIGLEDPDGGQILIGGESATGENLRNRYRLAMVFQSGGLLNSLTVAENVGIYLTEHRLKPRAEIARIVADAIRLVQLDPSVGEQYPDQLSGGMRKRVAIARALVIEPQLILYDEPTSELDPLVAVTVGREILKLRRRTGATSVVVTHDRDLAFGVADRMAFLLDGELVAVGSPEEIRRHPHPLLRQFLAAEFHEEEAAAKLKIPQASQTP